MPWDSFPWMWGGAAEEIFLRAILAATAQAKQLCAEYPKQDWDRFVQYRWVELKNGLRKQCKMVEKSLMEFSVF